MEVGKLKNEVLGEIVLSEIQSIREDVLIRPGVGEDCAAIAYGDFACVLTTDPITGSGSQLGKLAVHVCLNDIASSGAEPVGLLLTLLCPEGTSKDEIQGILREANHIFQLYSVLLTDPLLYGFTTNFSNFHLPHEVVRVKIIKVFQINLENFPIENRHPRSQKNPYYDSKSPAQQESPRNKVCHSRSNQSQGNEPESHVSFLPKNDTPGNA